MLQSQTSSCDIVLQIFVPKVAFKQQIASAPQNQGYIVGYESDSDEDLEMIRIGKIDLNIVYSSPFNVRRSGMHLKSKGDTLPS